MVGQPSTGIASVRAALRLLGVGPRKALGQHFLVDSSTLRAIVEAADLSPEDLVVEIGPGLGILTQELARRAQRVVAVELDTELAQALQEHMPPSVQVISADARRVDVCGLVDGRAGYKLMGNLPYYAALPILRHFLASPCRPGVAVLMVQKEVALSMTAGPGEMGLLSVAVQVYGHPRIVRTVRPGAFYPRPKVTSAVVRIEVHSNPLVPPGEMDSFFQMVRAGFSAPRKQLRNALAQGLDIAPERAKVFLEEAGIDPQRRPATVTLEEWRRLHRLVEGPL